LIFEIVLHNNAKIMLTF